MFVNASSYYISPLSEPAGLIDNNLIISGKILVFGGSNHGTQSAGWYNDLNLGTNEAVYIEDNTFSKDSTYQSNCTDSGRSGKYVFRFNTVTNTYVMAHGVRQDTANYRGTRKWEIYNNVFTTTGTRWAANYLRAGTGMVFNNSYIESGGTWSNNILFDIERATSEDVAINDSWAGRCDGDNTIDGNDDAYGYACRDQIGRSIDASWWEVQATVPAPDQTEVPVYIWGNDDGASVANATVVSTAPNPSLIVANRDYYNYSATFNGTVGMGSGLLADRPATCTTGVGYWVTDEGEWNSENAGNDGRLYKCTSTNTWSLYYTPYQYPHPLRSGTYLLTVTKAGDGSGTVTSSPTGIDYGATASYLFASGTEVTLTATPAGDYNTFDGWSGEGCSGTGTCVVTMSAAKNVTATFSQTTPDQYAVIVSYAGTGVGTTSPAYGSHAYTVAAEVTITATEGANASFAGWSGTCGATGTGNAVFNMPANDCTAIATFTDDTRYSLTVAYPTTGIVTTDVGGINCGDYNLDCSTSYYSGSTVVLSTTACSAGSHLVYSGDCTGGDCSLSMTADKSVSVSCVGNVEMGSGVPNVPLGGTGLINLN